MLQPDKCGTFEVPCAHTQSWHVPIAFTRAQAILIQSILHQQTPWPWTLRSRRLCSSRRCRQCSLTSSVALCVRTQAPCTTGKWVCGRLPHRRGPLACSATACCSSVEAACSLMRIRSPPRQHRCWHCCFRPPAPTCPTIPALGSLYTHFSNDSVWDRLVTDASTRRIRSQSARPYKEGAGVLSNANTLSG